MSRELWGIRGGDTEDSYALLCISTGEKMDYALLCISTEEKMYSAQG